MRDNTAKRIAEFIARFHLRNVPEKVQETAKLHILDGFACMLGGVNEDASRILHRRLLKSLRIKQATIVGTHFRASAEQAALINGVQAHVLDYDDAQLATLASRPAGQQVHPTAPILAAALAVSEAEGLSGSALLVAYIAGVEVACRFGDAIGPSHYLDGFHPTGTLGVFGATAGCAHLLRLNPEQTQWALGIAGTFACGLRAHRGTMAKALSAGRAAENGVLAATLAKSGFTASSNVFDDAMGFFSAAAKNNVNKDLMHFGEPLFFEKPGIAIKLYPCPGTLHPALDALIDLVERQDIKPDRVATVRVSLNAKAALPLVYPNPKTALEAKFSLPFSTAVAISDRAAGLGQFTRDKLKDRNILRLMRRVRLITHQEATASEVELVLKNGARFHARTAIARGHPRLPASQPEIESKFRQCAEASLSRAAVERFLKKCWNIDQADSIAKWLAPLRTKQR